jgi:hypothetical protein
MMDWQMAVPAVSGAAALGLGALVTQRLLGYRNTGAGRETLGEVVAETAKDRYRPMARLLDSEDLRFLESRPGYRREMGTRLRNSRRRIFRMYLKELSADFQNLHAAARRMVAEAPEQYADLVPLLMRQQAAFWLALAGIEMRLALSWAGFAPSDARVLVELMDQLQRALVAAAPLPATA